MAPNKFIAITLLLLARFACVSTQNFPTPQSELEGLTPCKNDDDCDDLKNATCSNGLCFCGNKDFICEATSYVVANKMGGKCEESRNCNLENSVCGPEKTCVCKVGFVASGDLRKCLEVTLTLGDPCEEDGQCSAFLTYSICQNRSCICQNNTHKHDGWCMRSAALGEECYQNEECVIASSSCVKSKCKCSENLVAINGKCLQTAQDIGDGCEHDIQCTTAFGDGSHCLHGICQCRDLYQFKAANSTCVRDIFLGEMCGEDAHCHRRGAKSSRLRCLAGFCKCKEEYHEVEGLCSDVISSQKLAEQKVESSHSCQKDADCKPNAFCHGNDDTVKGKCKCLDGFELVSNSTFYECLKGVPLGEACEKDFQCQLTADMAECNQYKICSCISVAKNYTNGMCYLKVKLREICLTDANCYLGNETYGFCDRGRCSCARGQWPSSDNSTCIFRRKMGEECASDEECRSVANARCMGVCRCGGGYAMSRSGKACVKAATEFGQNCTFDGECSEYLSQSICIDEKYCGCSEGQHGYGNRCVYTRKVQQHCEEDAQCIYDHKLEKNVQCLNGACHCIYGTSEDSCNIETFDNSASASLKLTVNLLLLFIVKILYNFHQF